MKIDVTADDIRLGKRCVATLCPVARAIRRAMKCRWRRWVVRIDKIEDNEGANEYLTPLKVVAFIRRFDNKKPVEPFSFELKVKE